MNHDVPSKFGIPDSQDPAKKLKAERPDLAARIQVMKNNEKQRIKILGTANPSSVPEVRSALDLRAKPFDPNDPGVKLGQRVLPKESEKE